MSGATRNYQHLEFLYQISQVKTSKAVMRKQTDAEGRDTERGLLNERFIVSSSTLKSKASDVTSHLNVSESRLNLRRGCSPVRLILLVSW